MNTIDLPLNTLYSLLKFFAQGRTILLFPFREPGTKFLFEVEALFGERGVMVDLGAAAVGGGRRVCAGGAVAERRHTFYRAGTGDLVAHVKTIFKCRINVLFFRCELLLFGRWRYVGLANDVGWRRNSLTGKVSKAVIGTERCAHNDNSRAVVRVIVGLRPGAESGE